MKSVVKTIIKVALIVLLSALLLYVITVNFSHYAVEGSQEIRTIFRIRETMTATQLQWIVIWESLLILFLVLLLTLSIILFNRYRKTEKIAAEASQKARELMLENEALDRLNSMKAEFVQNMSHDFQTPLTVISTSVLNALDLLDYGMDEEEMRESLNLAQSEIMRMSRKVNDALNLANQSESQGNKEAIDLPKLLKEVANTYKVLLRSRGNTLSYSVDDSLPPIHSNADALLNVFANLVSNANRHTKNGKIIITATIADNRMRRASDKRDVTITVCDNGTGIKPEMLADVFKRGFSSDSTGLGLPICKKVIESNGGAITVTSEYGKGTEVKFTVPVCAEERSNE